MKPSIGRIVHYVQNRPAGYGEGVIHLPAIIVSVWSDQCVNLQVFTDCSNSESGQNSNQPSAKWVTSVTYSESPVNHTWHWPEKVE